MLKSSLRLLSSPCLRESFVSPGKLVGEAARLTINSCEVRITSRNINTTSTRQKAEDKKMMLASLPPKDEGTLGEKSIQIDNLVGSVDVFPDEDTPFKLFNGIPFKDLPVCNIRVSPNNTIITIADSKGAVKLERSCGVEGFKNARKGTNIAAQATATTLSIQAVRNGYKTVRVRVRGLGPGRMSAIKGLQIGGLDIVSITDNTRVSWNPPRPRKARRL